MTFIFCMALSAKDRKAMPLEVCSLRENATKYDGKRIRVRGYMAADLHHFTALEDPTCGKAIAVNYDVDEVPKEFSSTVARRRVKSEQRKYEVVLRGRFVAKTCRNWGCFPRIVVDQVESAKFVDEGLRGK
jgi:hypothetical protein